MKKLFALTLLVAAGAAYAQPAPQASGKKAEPERTAMCNELAKDLKGSERASYVKECVSSNKMTPQDREKACTRQAAERKDDDRVAFMNSCMATNLQHQGKPVAPKDR